MTVAQLWDRLKADALVEGDPPPPDRGSPWFVRVMLGIAGWIGAAFLFGFVGLAFASLLDNAAAAMIVGAFLCGGAFLLLRNFDGHDFAEQFGLVVSLVGQILIIVGLGQFLDGDDAFLYLAVAAMEVALALAVPNFLHRMLAAGGAAIALGLAINEMELHGLATPILCLGLVIIWLEPRHWAGDGRLWRPIGYGLVLALLLVETTRLVGSGWLFGRSGEAPGWMALHGPVIGRALAAALLLWVAIALARREGFSPGSRIGVAAAGAAILFGLLSLQAPGLASAMLILLLGFAAGNRILLAIGIFSLLGFVAHFYYDLYATLLEKSGILAVTGLCLLAGHFALRRGFPPSLAQEPENA
jgi:hypothetical protein